MARFSSEEKIQAVRQYMDGNFLGWNSLYLFGFNFHTLCM